MVSNSAEKMLYNSYSKAHEFETYAYEALKNKDFNEAVDFFQRAYHMFIRCENIESTWDRHEAANRASMLATKMWEKSKDTHKLSTMYGAILSENY